MDGNPHTHSPSLSRNDYPYEWTLTYGDTKIRVYHGLNRGNSKPPTPEQVRRALLRAVKQHDEGSKVAAKSEERYNAAMNAIKVEAVGQIAALPKTGVWASDALKLTESK